MALDHRIGAHAGRRIDGFLRRHEGAAARRIEFQAMIATHHAIAFETSLRKRHQTVPAGVLQRGDLSVGLAVEHDVLAADRPRKQRVLDIDVPGCGVPGIHREGSGHEDSTSLGFFESTLYTGLRRIGQYTSENPETASEMYTELRKSNGNP